MRLADAAYGKLPGEERPELQHPTPDRFIGDIQPALGEQILDVAELRVKRKYNRTACRMTSDGNWWRTNEIVVIRHHSRESESRQSFRVNSVACGAVGPQTRCRIGHPSGARDREPDSPLC